MSKIEVSGVTVSVDFGDKKYGEGTGSFMNLQGKYPEGVSLEELDDVIVDGLDMYFAAWKTLFVGRFATGQSNLSTAEFKDTLAMNISNIDKIRKYIRKLAQNGQQQ